MVRNGSAHTRILCGRPRKVELGPCRNPVKSLLEACHHHRGLPRLHRVPWTVPTGSVRVRPVLVHRRARRSRRGRGLERRASPWSLWPDQLTYTSSQGRGIMAVGGLEQVGKGDRPRRVGVRRGRVARRETDAESWSQLLERCSTRRNGYTRLWPRDLLGS